MRPAPDDCHAIAIADLDISAERMPVGQGDKPIARRMIVRLDVMLPIMPSRVANTCCHVPG